MCKWRICIRLGHRRICFCIPLLIDPRWFLKPDPGPFFEHPDFDRQIQRHLQVLATIDRLAVELPAELATDFHRSVETQLTSLTQKLGEGVELSQHIEKA
jgi:hypothetical protein